MVTTKLNLSMTEPQVRQIYAKQGDTGRVLDISLDQTPEDGTLRILRPDGVEVTSEAVTGGEVESGSTFESLTEADVTELTVGIEPVQDLSHGDPSPSNICPITGHDEVTVFFGAEQGTADETYTTSLGQTVYGGTLDMVTGQLVVDKAMVTLDETIADGGWLKSSLYQGGYYMRWDTMGYLTGLTFQTGSNSFIRCSHAKLALTMQEYILGTIFSDGSCNIRVLSPSSTLAEWIQYIKDQYNAGTPIQVVQRLASPQTYQLTAQQIKTLVGTNNVWASSGDIVSIKFSYGGLLSKLPSDATSVVGKCYCDIEQNGVSSMPFTLNVKKNERES